MFTEDLRRVVMREAATLREQIMAYPEERQIWEIAPGTKNSAGTLALHLAGNLQHVIGAQFGGTGYVRDRDAEFSRRDVPRMEVIAEIDRALAAAHRGLMALKDEDFARPYPAEVGGHQWPTGLFLLHVASHLAYHLGQIDYHRRIVTGQAGSVAGVTLKALKDEG